MITEKMIKRREQAIVEAARRAATKTRRAELKKARQDIVELLARGCLQHAVAVAEKAGILFEVPRKYLLARAGELRMSWQVEALELAAKIYEHFHIADELGVVRGRIKEIEERQFSREMVEGLTR